MCICLGGLFFCGDKPPKEDTVNGSILKVASVIKNMVASAAESEVGACFQNAQSGAPIRNTLIEMRHKKPATALRKYNFREFGILNETIKQKRSKSMDVRNHWLTDRLPQKQFNVYWRPGHESLGDYHKIHLCSTTPNPSTPLMYARIYTNMPEYSESHTSHSSPISIDVLIRVEPLMLLNLIMSQEYLPMPSLMFGTSVALRTLLPSLLSGMLLNSLAFSCSTAVNYFSLLETLNHLSPICINLTFIIHV
jgi:hypothetical protein